MKVLGKSKASRILTNENRHDIPGLGRSDSLSDLKIRDHRTYAERKGMRGNINPPRMKSCYVKLFPAKAQQEIREANEQ
jgi:hypothetical protein